MNSHSFQDESETKEDEPFYGQQYNHSIDTALATIHESQVTLSQMADAKANIMITVSSILLTLSITRVEQGVLQIPGILFALCCVPSLIFAILCVMPMAANPEKPVSKSGRMPHFNPLFFMHYTLIPMRHFEKEIERVLVNPQYLYRNLTQDIYQAGLVLRTKKYRYLRWSYISLLTGILAGCLALLFELGSGLWVLDS